MVQVLFGNGKAANSHLAGITMANQVDGGKVGIVGKSRADVIKRVLAQGDHQGGTRHGIGAGTDAAGGVGVGKVVICNIDHPIHQGLVIMHCSINKDHLADGCAAKHISRVKRSDLQKGAGIICLGVCAKAWGSRGSGIRGG